MWKTSKRLESGNRGYAFGNESIIAGWWEMPQTLEEEEEEGFCLCLLGRMSPKHCSRFLFIYISCVCDMCVSPGLKSVNTTKMVWIIAWKRRAIQLLTKTARWGEKKGQCGESERERERNRWQQKESCWAQQGVWKAKKCQQKRDEEDTERWRAEQSRTERKGAQKFKCSTC